MAGFLLFGLDFRYDQTNLRPDITRPVVMAFDRFQCHHDLSRPDSGVESRYLDVGLLDPKRYHRRLPLHSHSPAGEILNRGRQSEWEGDSGNGIGSIGQRFLRDFFRDSLRHISHRVLGFFDRWRVHAGIRFRSTGMERGRVCFVDFLWQPSFFVLF